MSQIDTPQPPEGTSVRQAFTGPTRRSMTLPWLSHGGVSLIAAALTVVLVSAFGGVALVSHLRAQAQNRHLLSARASLAGLSWPAPFTRFDGDHWCLPSPDEACVATPDSPTVAATKAAKFLRASPQGVRPIPSAVPGLNGATFETHVGGEATVVGIFPTETITKVGAKPRITVTGSIVAVSFAD